MSYNPPYPSYPPSSSSTSFPPPPTTGLPPPPAFPQGLPPPPPVPHNTQYQPPPPTQYGAPPYPGGPPPPPSNQGYSGGYGYDQGQGSRPPPVNEKRRDERPPRGRGRSPEHNRTRPRPVSRDRREDRLSRERPCRTLFIRNISYEADTEALRRSFATYGEIREVFDIANRRGMLFVSYYDLRAAQRAKEAMHGLEINGRTIDVHYSLPKGDEQSGRCDRDKNQGSILATLRSRRPLPEFELGQCAERYGAIKTIRSQREPDTKLVEFFDSRGAAMFLDEMHDKPFMGSLLDLKFVWDEPEVLPLPPPGRDREPPRRGEAHGHVKADRGYGGDRRGSRDQGGSQGYDDRRGSYTPAPPPGPPLPRYPEAPPPQRYPDAPPAQQPPLLGDDRYEQAKKVQQLLASLGGAAAAAPPPAAGGYANAPRNLGAPPAYGGGGPPPPPPANYGAPSSQSTYAPPAQRAGPDAYGGAPPPPAPAPTNRYGPPPSQGGGGGYSAPPPPQQQQPQQNAYPPYAPPTNPSPDRRPYPPANPPNQHAAEGYRQSGPGPGGYGAPHPPSNGGYGPPPPGSNPGGPPGRYGPPAEQGYAPSPGQGPVKDVNSLLAMLQQNR